MFSTQSTYIRRGNLQGLILSVILFASMFAFVAPLAVNSVSSTVTASAIEKLTSSLTQSISTSASAINIIAETITNTFVIEAIEELGGEVSTVYTSVNALAATVPANKLLELASNPNVKRVYADAVKYLASGQTNPSKAGIEPGPTELELTEEALEINIVDVEDIGTTPYGYAVAELTHAMDIWEETDAGSQSIVAIIDTGCWNESYTDPGTGYTYIPWYLGNVIGGIDLSYDVGTDYEGYGNPMNHYHGHGVGSFLAAHVEIVFRAGHPWGKAFIKYYPQGGYIDGDGRIHLFVFGVAPAASIYAVKVFDHTGGGIPTSIVMAGMDHVIQKKISGEVDIDIMSMSLGGGVGADGEDPEDLLVDAATEAGILVSVAAGNEGPAPLKVGSPGSAKTCITVGGAADPIHERAYAEAVYNLNWLGPYWWPSEEYGLYRWTSKGPTADGRQKPDVISTATHLFFGLTPASLPYTVGLGSGTSFSCPQVSGEAALLISYAKLNDKSYTPWHIKKAIIDGAELMEGFIGIEQGAGYINCANSLEIFGAMPDEIPPETYPWPHHIHDFWIPPVKLLYLSKGKATIRNLVLEPAKYAYYSFWVTSEVDSIKITISNVELAPEEEQNPIFYDTYNVYLSTAARGGVDEYLIGYPDAPQYFWGDSVQLVVSNVDFQPGVVNLVIENDFSSYNAISFGEITIEITEVTVNGFDNCVYMWNTGIKVQQAQVEVYPGKIEKYYGSVKEGETDGYIFNIPDDTGFAYVILSWYHDWAHWATNDLDLIIINPDGTLNVDGAKGASPEAAFISGAGDYTLLVDGYGVYFDKAECYYLEIVYFADSVPLWSSSTFTLKLFTVIKSPVSGLAVVWLYDEDFDYWYIGGFAQLAKKKCCDPGHGNLRPN